MTKQEIYLLEQSNTGAVVLYPEGKFYKAYERSAWLLCMRIHQFKVACRWVGTAGAYMVSVGFPFESLGKWLGDRILSDLDDGRKQMTFAETEVTPQVSFDEWKENQVRETATRIQSESKESPGDTGLRLYGAAYRLSLELAKDSALLQKNYRYSLGEQLRMKSFRLVLDVESAGVSSDKQAFVIRSIEDLREVQLCLRMLADLAAMPERRFVYYMEMTADISKQLHNWEKSLRYKEARAGVCAGPLGDPGERMQRAK